MSKASGKLGVSDLARFGGEKMFDRVRGTPNLVRPDIEKFLNYSQEFFEARRYTNGGPLVRKLEARLAGLHGVKHCVAFSNAFWAIVTTIQSLAIEGRTELVMPSLTYRRLADIVSWTGLTPHFCEVNPDTLAMDPKFAIEAVNERTALLLAPHPIVNNCDVAGMEELSKQTGIPLVFDSVESAMETYRGKMIGGFGRAECFSMHSSKLLNGFEGGYVTTNDAELAERLAYIRGFGFADEDKVVVLGLNAKLNEVHAAMAHAAIDDLPDQIERNRKRYQAYRSLLKDVRGIRLLEFDANERRCFKSIVVELLDTWPLSRPETIDLLHAEGALVRPYYSPPQHLKKMAYATICEDLRETERLAGRFLLLPCGEHVDEDDIRRVVDLLVFMREHSTEIQSALKGAPLS
ncbi:MAG: DegT/DnrJ/EryC1/StrS family aminotransferase [Candidatus Baltobacteraceae bacterium]